MTEEEVSRGLFWREDREQRAFVFKREIENLGDLAKSHGKDEPLLRDFIDMVCVSWLGDAEHARAHMGSPSVTLVVFA